MTTSALQDSLQGLVEYIAYFACARMAAGSTGTGAEMSALSSPIGVIKHRWSLDIGVQAGSDFGSQLFWTFFGPGTCVDFDVDQVYIGDDANAIVFDVAVDGGFVAGDEAVVDEAVVTEVADDDWNTAFDVESDYCVDLAANVCAAERLRVLVDIFHFQGDYLSATTRPHLQHPNCC